MNTHHIDDIPLAIGPVCNTVSDHPTIIREELIDSVQSAITHTGGTTHLNRTLERAAPYQIKSSIHAHTGLSAVDMTGALHLGLAVRKFGVHECIHQGAGTEEVFRQSFAWSACMLRPGGEPGLGTQLDPATAAGYHDVQVYLGHIRVAEAAVHTS